MNICGAVREIIVCCCLFLTFGEQLGLCKRSGDPSVYFFTDGIASEQCSMQISIVPLQKVHSAALDRCASEEKQNVETAHRLPHISALN